MIYDRQKLLSQAPVDITPTNVERKFPWSRGQDIDQFEQEWSMRPVKIKGIFDHLNEIQVEKMKNGEKGVDIITPFYTHLNEKGEECGILVNRGWVPLDFWDSKSHYTGIMSGEIVGVLYRGDNETKYTKENEPTLDRYTIVKPYDLALMA